VIEFGKLRVPGWHLGVLVDLCFPSLGRGAGEGTASVNDGRPTDKSGRDFAGENPRVGVLSGSPISMLGGFE
jgi:hypothetical protein